MNADSFDDICAVLALYRPGPMGVNAHTNYADYKNKRKPQVPIHSELAEPLVEILGDTYGLIVYQEQVMAIAQKVAGYTLAQADQLRRAMSHKRSEEKMREVCAEMVDALKSRDAAAFQRLGRELGPEHKTVGRWIAGRNAQRKRVAAQSRLPPNSARE